jgi:hypothetical protein
MEPNTAGIILAVIASVVVVFQGSLLEPTPV